MLALRDAAESKGNPLMVMDVWCIVSGIYIWEFVTNLDYEWSVIRGHQRYRWTIWIYSISRLSCLVAVVFAMVNFSLKSEINCQVWITIGWAISSMGVTSLSSILLMLRIVAIWDRNKVVMAISAAIWITNAGFQLSGVVRAHSVWVPAARACTNLDLNILKGTCVNALATDVALLLIMLAGLLRLRLRDGAFLNLAHVLWKQGVIWLAIATAAELPQVVLLFFNLNDSLHSLFLLPSAVTVVIAATRMYRDLTYYGPSTPLNTIPDSSNLPKSNRVVSSAKKSSIVHIPSNRLEVTVHRAYEEHLMSQMNHCGSYSGSDTQLADKPPHELGLDDNVEAS